MISSGSCTAKDFEEAVERNKRLRESESSENSPLTKEQGE